MTAPDGKEIHRELRKMSREQLVELGGERDGVRVVASEPKLPDDERLRRRAGRRVAACYVLSVVFAACFVAAFVAWPRQYVAAGEPGHLAYLLYNPIIGSSFGLAVVTLGIGLTMQFKRLMPEETAVQQWETAGPSDVVDRRTAAARLKEAGTDTGLGRLPLARRALVSAVGALGAIAGVLAIGTFVRSPWRGGDQAALWVTPWKSFGGEKVYLRMPTGVTGEIVRVRPEDVAPGGLVTVVPYRESDRGDKELLDAAEHASDAPVILVRFRPGTPVRQPPGQESYHYGDFYAFSKICTHLGCPAGLFNELTGVTLCPCHQSSFDLTDGAKVVFGPAVRPLPQLPITVDEQGYFVATGDFSAPVGPGFWEVRA